MPFKEGVRIRFPISNHVIPAQAGNQLPPGFWFLACAGMPEITALVEFGKPFWTHSKTVP
jgi:hypothetical protein